MPQSPSFNSRAPKGFRPLVSKSMTWLQGLPTGSVSKWQHDHIALAKRKATEIATTPEDDAFESAMKRCKSGAESDSKVTYSDDATAFCKAHEITVHDRSAPPPCLSLASAPFPQPLVSILTSQGFSTPSAVQAASWPIAVAGRDVLAIAKTGSGKTLGYLLPVMARCHAVRKGAWSKLPFCVVMAPTRELAIQICEQATKFGSSLKCRAVAVYGGAPKWSQTQSLQRGCDIVVATPGRMIDMLDLHKVSWTGASTSLDACEVMVLDEADRMLDMGFEKDIRSIADAMPHARQTLLYTATWPKAVQRVAADLLNSSTMVKVTVGAGGDKLTANKNVSQRVKVVERHEKWDAFTSLLDGFKPGGSDEGKRVLVFANTKKDVNAIGSYCWERKFAVDTISGDRTQGDRERVIKSFRAGGVTMVIATDVAARGLDITGIDRVINYDYPPGDGGSDDYIHRIGRTGRAGAKGIADTLFTWSDVKHAAELMRILSDAGQPVPAALAEMSASSGGGKQRWGNGKPNHRRNQGRQWSR